MNGDLVLAVQYVGVFIGVLGTVLAAPGAFTMNLRAIRRRVCRIAPWVPNESDDAADDGDPHDQEQEPARRDHSQDTVADVERYAAGALRTMREAGREFKSDLQTRAEQSRLLDARSFPFVAVSLVMLGLPDAALARTWVSVLLLALAGASILFYSLNRLVPGK